jgi:hypothetical protein
MDNTNSYSISTLSQKVQSGLSLNNVDLDNLSLSLAQISGSDKLSDYDKNNLKILFDYFIVNSNDNVFNITLFSKRFNKELSSNWIDVPVSFLSSMWKSIENIPSSHFELNENIKAIVIESFGESQGQGDYLSSIRQIILSKEMFFDHPDDVVPLFLHEIGHAIRQKISNEDICSWYSSYGWYSSSDDDSGIEGWIGIMGGWDNLSAEQQIEIRRCIRECFGVSERTLTRGPAPQNIFPGHPWESFKTKAVYDKTFDFWYEHLDQSYQYNGLVFFMNFYYKQLMAVSKSTVDLIYNSNINKYSLMGPEEFFAELYSYYYDPNQRALLSKEIQIWFKIHVDTV